MGCQTLVSLDHVPLRPMRIPLNRRQMLLASAFLIVGGRIAYGGDDDDDDHEDHDRAFRALREGEARPLADILEKVEEQLGGDIVGIEFERENGRYVYELKIVAPDGRLREVNVDAMTAEILSGERD